jgi:hypothetical protein
VNLARRAGSDPALRLTTHVIKEGVKNYAQRDAVVNDFFLEEVSAL